MTDREVTVALLKPDIVKEGKTEEILEKVILTFSYLTVAVTGYILCVLLSYGAAIIYINAILLMEFVDEGSWY